MFKANRLQEDLLTRLANIDRESGLTANQKSMLQPFRKRVMDAHKITVNKIMSEFMKESEALLTRTDLRYADSDADSDIEEFLVSSDSESEQELDDEEPDPNSAPSSAKRPRLRFAAKVMASAKASVKDVPKAAPNLVKKTQVQLRF